MDPVYTLRVEEQMWRALGERGPNIGSQL